MKQLVIAIAVLAFIQASDAQELIFLKDGTVVKGEVTASTEKSEVAVWRPYSAPTIGNTIALSRSK